MTAISVNLEVYYRNWYDKAIEFVFNFFEDPLYGDVDQKGFLSRLLLDPKTLLMLIAYFAYLCQRLLRFMLRYSLWSLQTNVNNTSFFLFTDVNYREGCFVTSVNNNPSLFPRVKLKVFLIAHRGSFMGGWAFLRIFRQLLPNNFVNYCAQWEKSIEVFFSNGFQYFLIGYKASANMPF